MSDGGERTPKKWAVLGACGMVLFAAVGFALGLSSGQSRQLKNDAVGNVVFSLHYLNLLESTNLEKLNRELRFSIWANMQNHLGELVTNGMDPKQVARVSEIYSQMSSQVVAFTPEQFITNVSGK
jgi:hypothetical protein